LIRLLHLNNSGDVVDADEDVDDVDDNVCECSEMLGDGDVIAIDAGIDFFANTG